MAGDDNDPIVEAFLQEATELVADFEASLLGLEQATGDRPEILSRMFRAAHTVKGGASMLGFDDVAHFTHALEDLLDQLRKELRPVDSEIVDILLAANDVLRAMISRAVDATAATGEEQAEIERVGRVLRALVAQDPPAPPASASPAPEEADPPPAATPGERRWEIHFRPPADVLRRGLDPLHVMRELGRIGRIVDVAADTSGLPELAALDPEQCYLAWRLVLETARPLADIEACFEFVADPDAVRIAEAIGSATTSESTSAQPQAALAPLAGQGLQAPASPAPAAAAAAPPPVARPAASPRAAAPSPAPAAAGAGAASIARLPGQALGAGEAAGGALNPERASIRVPIAKVDRLINLVGELVITQSMVAEAVENFSMDKLAALAEAVAQMDRHARQLHENVVAVRMVPIGTLFGRFTRLVRDLAGSVGKQIALELCGEDTELDKTVIEKIGDPLTHLVRNSIDHGLETPEERRAAGKPAAGRIRLEAYQRSGSVFIDVSDDGRGLDRERIVAKAVQNGLISAGQTLTDDEAFRLILLPGFSTAEQVTELSGRGVGMDVVKRNVEVLGGTIAIRSEAGRGTLFRIRLPLTLAIMDGQTLQVGDQVYILPLVSITESVRPAPGTVHAIPGAGEVVVVRGESLPLVRLHALLDVEPRFSDPTQGLIVIARHEAARVALLVDELLGQQQTVIKSLETHFRRIEGIAGATILGDGRVALILDVPGLIALASPGERQAA